MSEPATHERPPRKVGATYTVSVPPVFSGRAPIQFTINARGQPFFWCPERMDLGSDAKGVYRFLYFADGRVIRLPIPATLARFPLLVPFVDGRLLLLSGLDERRDAGDNAAVYAPDGALHASFRTADVVRNAQVAADGKIWVDYSDESRGGQLDCFSAEGKRLFDYASFWQQTGVPPMGAGCLLNVADDDEAWTYYYNLWPLVRIRNFQLAGRWDASAVRGAYAFAVDGHRALFVGQYPERDEYVRIRPGSDRHRLLYLLTLATGEVETLQPVSNGDDGDLRGAPIEFAERESIGRGSRLYLNDGRSIHVFDLAQIA